MQKRDSMSSQTLRRLNLKRKFERIAIDRGYKNIGNRKLANVERNCTSAGVAKQARVVKQTNTCGGNWTEGLSVATLISTMEFDTWHVARARHRFVFFGLVFSCSSIFGACSWLACTTFSNEMDLSGCCYSVFQRFVYLFDVSITICRRKISRTDAHPRMHGGFGWNAIFLLAKGWFLHSIT